MLGIEELIVAGYSMGGLVAQLLWRRHPHLTSGLVLCSTARSVLGSAQERYARLMMPSVVAVASWTPATYQLRADVVGARVLDRDGDPRARQWVLDEMRRTPLLTALSAIHAVAEFSSHEWIGLVDVPTAVVITRNDGIVPPRQQLRLARALPDSVVYEVEGDHGVFLNAPGRFAAALVSACTAVALKAAGYHAISGARTA